MKSSRLKGNLIMLLVAFVWGSSFIAQSVGMEKIGPATFVWARSFLGAAVLLPVIFVFDKKKKSSGQEICEWKNKDLIAGGILCGVILFFASFLQTAGMVYTSPGKAGFITALYMIFVPMIGFVLGKKPSPAVLLAAAVAIIGMYLLCIKPGEAMGRGDMLVFYCSLLYSLHIVVIDHFSPKVDGVKLACLQFFISGVLGGIWMMIFENPDPGLIWECRAAIGYSGIMSCGVAYTLQIIGQKYTDPTSASILMSLESVFSTLSTVVLVALGWQLTGGALSAREIAGCVIMFAAIILVQLPDIVNKKQRI